MTYVPFIILSYLSEAIPKLSTPIQKKIQFSQIKKLELTLRLENCI